MIYKIKEIELEYSKNFTKYFNHAFYNINLITLKGTKYKLFSFMINGKTSHGVNLKHKLIEKICKSNSVAMLNLKNDQDTRIAIFAKVKLEAFSNIEIIVRNSKDMKITNG